jgi:hypothetical protein
MTLGNFFPSNVKVGIRIMQTFYYLPKRFSISGS